MALVVENAPTPIRRTAEGAAVALGSESPRQAETAAAATTTAARASAAFGKLRIYFLFIGGSSTNCPQ
jgi:hypothetical protein